MYNLQNEKKKMFIVRTITPQSWKKSDVYAQRTQIPSCSSSGGLQVS